MRTINSPILQTKKLRLGISEQMSEKGLEPRSQTMLRDEKGWDRGVRYGI